MKNHEPRLEAVGGVGRQCAYGKIRRPLELKPPDYTVKHLAGLGLRIGDDGSVVLIDVRCPPLCRRIITQFSETAPFQICRGKRYGKGAYDSLRVCGRRNIVATLGRLAVAQRIKSQNGKNTARHDKHGEIDLHQRKCFFHDYSRLSVGFCVVPMLLAVSWPPLPGRRLKISIVSLPLPELEPGVPGLNSIT